MTSHRPPLISSFISDYGMIIGLLLLCVFFSYVTWDEQHATGLGAANQLRENITKEFPPGSTVLIVARNHQEDVNFAESLAKQLKDFDQSLNKVLLNLAKRVVADGEGSSKFISDS